MHVFTLRMKIKPKEVEVAVAVVATSNSAVSLTTPCRHVRTPCLASAGPSSYRRDSPQSRRHIASPTSKNECLEKIGPIVYPAFFSYSKNSNRRCVFHHGYLGPLQWNASTNLLVKIDGSIPERMM